MCYLTARRLFDIEFLTFITRHVTCHQSGLRNPGYSLSSSLKNPRHKTNFTKAEMQFAIKTSPVQVNKHSYNFKIGLSRCWDSQYVVNGSFPFIPTDDIKATNNIHNFYRLLLLWSIQAPLCRTPRYWWLSWRGKTAVSCRHFFFIYSRCTLIIGYTNTCLIYF